MQHEITKSAPLLNEKGYLREPGYAKSMLPVYDRKAIKASGWRIKEWDYYYIGNSHFGVALTIADNSYMGLDSISLLNFDEPWEHTSSSISWMTFGKVGFPSTSSKGNVCHGGRIHFDGRDYIFDTADSFAVLDWGRGVWTYKNTWYWGSASGMVNDIPFGFNIGYGFGDTSAATENMLFYNHKAHKLDQVTFHIPVKAKQYKSKGSCCTGSNIVVDTADMTEDYLSPWRFTSNDGRFEMDFLPIIDRHADTDVKLIRSNQHQVFGQFSGSAILDDGTVIEIKDFIGFAEKVYNKW